MENRIIISPKARLEIEEITDYYFEINIIVLIHFNKILSEIYGYLITNLHSQIRYKNYRSIPLKDFPYLLFFIIDEDKKLVKILSCFHSSSSPKKYPK